MENQYTVDDGTVCSMTMGTTWHVCIFVLMERKQILTVVIE